MRDKVFVSQLLSEQPGGGLLRLASTGSRAPPAAGDRVRWAGPPLGPLAHASRFCGGTFTSVSRRAFRHCRGKVEMSYFGAGSRRDRRLCQGLPFPPPGSSCIATSRQGFPPAPRLAALTAPGRDATRTPQRREWQASHWLEAHGIGHFYFAPTVHFITSPRGYFGV